MTTSLRIVCPHCDTINRLPRERLRDRAKCGSCHQPLYKGRPAELDSVVRFDRHDDKLIATAMWIVMAGPRGVPIRRFYRLLYAERGRLRDSRPDPHP